MKLKHINFHKDFKLNSNSFASVDDLLNYTSKLSIDTHQFLEAWFSNKEYVLVKTSGSTGTPKEIKLQKSQMQNSAIATGVFFGLHENTSALLCLPVVYIAGKMMLVRALTLGWHLDVGPADSNPLKDNFKAYDFSAMVPMQAENAIDNIHRIKKLIIGGGAVSHTLQEKLQHVVTAVFGTYGMTETITHIAVKKLNNFSPLYRGASEQSLHKDFYTTLPQTEIYKDERNCLVLKNTTISDVVIFTNDVVRLISDTQFEWLGRFDNVVNSGGIKLYPERIEEKLGSIMKQRFFVAGIQDDVLGEKLVLVVEGPPCVLDIKKAEVSKFEVPKKTYFIDHFVETATKKIQRKKTLDLINFN